MKKGKNKVEFDPLEHIPGILKQGNEPYEPEGALKRVLAFKKTLGNYELG